jgi:aminopeptidase N
VGFVKLTAMLLLAVAGGVQAATPMTDAEFQEFLDAATAELRQKQEILGTDYGLVDAATWGFDQVSQKLQFFDELFGNPLAFDIEDESMACSAKDASSSCMFPTIWSIGIRSLVLQW